MSIQILLLEDEDSIADALIFSLKAEGYRVQWCTLIQEALSQYQNADLLILDVGLPDGNGFELCKQIRRDSEVPVIFLTARSSEIDRVVGLEIGADDYVVKPFSPRELVARVKTILKRVQRQQEPPAQAPHLPNTAIRALTLGDFCLDPSTLTITLKQTPLTLTALEFRLLQHFIQHPRQVLSREQLLQAVGSAADAGYDRSIDTHIKSLRAKCRQISDLQYLITQRGFGYSFQPHGQPPC